MTNATVSDHITGLLIDGAWAAPSNDQWLETTAPADGQVFGRIARAGAADVNRAVGSARRALQGNWGRLNAVERGRLLLRAAQIVQDRAEDLAQLEARDTGKPIAQARADIAACARYLEYYAGAADKVHGHTIPVQNGYFAATEHVPHGVTAHVIPWNYPAQMFPRSIGPALAMGNAVVMKPAEDACATPLELAAIMIEAGFPPGSLNMVTGLGSEAGAALSEHPDINFISFIGSSETGVAIQTAAAKNHIGCTLELGGKSAQIVFADADPALVVPTVVGAVTQHAGQTCSAGSRLLIERSAMDTLVPLIADAFSKVRVVMPDMEGQLGPLINPRQKDRVERFLNFADSSGLPLLAKGQMAADLSPQGNFVEPHMYGPVPRDHRLAHEEVFGPVLAVIPFEDEADAVALANSTEYGLVAGIWTRDSARALRVGRQMEVGQVFVNCYGAGGGIELPFGGMKKSGHGREKGWEALLEFAAVRTILIRHD
ncbi:aldehyde dehydrogenase family protein [Sedimentitalea todarodis]|uniref:Aldehyde dehydrogenase family protein n=1 Tax=Sedimentitalea todarodis TaxID=1631240 RepID=A0ABU3VDE3_9RHOB|nr:aldehyde dehydrogenase family protein [Sedimentitalea todarodis]MDU9004200.1 aldehyde dehydrogenase family protein [Sedimentitalea todarodis]